MAQDNRQDRIGIRRAAAGALVLPLPWALRPAGFAELRDRLRRAAAEEFEQRRLFPWIAVAFGLGILLFFQAEGRPALWAPLFGCAAFTALAAAARHRPGVLIAMTGLAAVFAGFTTAVLRTRSVEAPVLARPLIAPLTGFIEAVEERPQGPRLTVRVTRLERLPVAEWPRRVRVSLRNGAGLAAGQHIGATARLLPPPQPAWPGGYDFARDAYFREIGAVGSLVGKVTPLPAPEPPDVSLRLAALVDAARNTLTERIAQAIGGQAGAVAAALVTGKRGLIEEPTNEVLRAAGIYHIVSISGLHMVLAAGTFFWVSRALLALSPTLALLWPVKRIAAAIAMVGATAYCLFSGSEIATERSLIMTLTLFGAVLVDRPALSMRNLALAALIVLAREPESLVGPSFQMSFGAVAALIAVAPWLPRARTDGPSDWLGRVVSWVLRAVLALLVTTLVASLATAPFAAYHFQALNPFGLVGNALALPLVSLAVMPAALLGVLAFPFGLDRPIWQVMGWAVARVLEVSAWVSGFDGSALVVPALGTGALLALSLALLLLTLPGPALRGFAVIPAGIGIALAASPTRYDAFIDRMGEGAAIRGRSGRLVLVGAPSGFVIEQWLRADGDARRPSDRSLREGARCDALGCTVVLADGRAAAFVQDTRAFEEDCRRAAIVITRLVAPPACKAALILDRHALDRSGAATLRIEGRAIVVRSTRPEEGFQPWTGRPPAQPPPTVPPPGSPPRRTEPGIDLPEGEDLERAETGNEAP